MRSVLRVRRLMRGAIGNRQDERNTWGADGLSAANSGTCQFFTVIVSESTAFLPVTPSSPVSKPR